MPEIDDDGLRLGAGTRLVRMRSTRFGAAELDLASDEARMLALLAAARGRHVGARVREAVVAASTAWRDGDKALANLRLVFCGLEKLTADETWRLYLAEAALSAGLAPDALLREIGIDAGPLGLLKYDPDQPRVPAGHGADSGRWTSGDGTQQPAPESRLQEGRSAAVAATASPFAADLLGAPVGSAFLSALANFAARVGAFAGLGAILFPVARAGKSEGDVPGSPGLRYSFDHDEGVLQLSPQDGSGSETAITGRLGHDGIIHESETATPRSARSTTRNGRCRRASPSDCRSRRLVTGLSTSMIAERATAR